MKRAYLLIGLVTCSPAAAHEAPMGWAYGYECCSGIDCSQSGPQDIRETKAGYLVQATGEVIPYGDKRIKISGDEYFHRCSHGGRATAGTICIYVPNRGF